MTREIDRRSFLRATGVALALPFLPSLRPAIARTSGEAPRRMVNICATLGLYSDSWFPKTSGIGYEPSEYLALIDEHRDHYTLFSGLCHEEQTGRQAHNSEITWLTSAKHPGLDGFQNTISVDQVVADHFGYVTRFPSIILGTYSPQSQSYTRNGVMVPARTSPAKLFADMFLEGKPEEVARETRRLSDGRSILDTLSAQTASLRTHASVTDQRVLDAYFEAVRVAERDLVEVQAWTERPKPVVDAPPPVDIGDNADVVGRVKLLFDLIPLILATDSSRVVSVMIQDHQTVPKVPGVTADQHNLSHHGQDPGKIEQLRIIEREIVGRFGELLTALRQQEDGEGSLLDHTTLLFRQQPRQRQFPRRGQAADPARGWRLQPRPAHRSPRGGQRPAVQPVRDHAALGGRGRGFLRPEHRRADLGVMSQRRLASFLYEGRKYARVNLTLV